MTVSSSLHKRTALLFGILFIAFFAFTADILDLREELRILTSPYSYLDNNVTTGITSHPTFETELSLLLFSVHRKSSVNISFYGFRAPPSWS
jgi:hypothetical protein